MASEKAWVQMSGDDPVAVYLRPGATEAFTVEVPLHRPDLRPIYGGPTLLEALWGEMDRLMEALMTGAGAEDICGKPDCEVLEDDRCPHEDNGDKYRAQELAWVLAIVTDPYNPSVDAIRKQAMERWDRAEPEGADQ